MDEEDLTGYLGLSLPLTGRDQATPPEEIRLRCRAPTGKPAEGQSRRISHWSNDRFSSVTVMFTSARNRQIEDARSRKPFDGSVCRWYQNDQEEILDVFKSRYFVFDH